MKKMMSDQRFANPCGVVFMKDDSGITSVATDASAVGTGRFVICHTTAAATVGSNTEARIGSSAMSIECDDS